MIKTLIYHITNVLMIGCIKIYNALMPVFTWSEPEVYKAQRRASVDEFMSALEDAMADTAARIEASRASENPDDPSYRN